MVMRGVLVFCLKLSLYGGQAMKDDEYECYVPFLNHGLLFVFLA